MSQQVDFYLLRHTDPAARAQFACRLTQKVYRLGERVHVEVDSDDSAQMLDELLWTFSDDSFIPHACLPDTDGYTPVTIGVSGQPVSDTVTVRINLTDTPLTATDCRIAEIVSGNDNEKAAGRERYAAYRDRGCALDTHKI
ncbi:MAG: DNA polymerase III subunit chi [Pseudomonadota bacterium]